MIFTTNIPSDFMLAGAAVLELSAKGRLSRGAGGATVGRRLRPRGDGASTLAVRRCCAVGGGWPSSRRAVAALRARGKTKTWLCAHVGGWANAEWKGWEGAREPEARGVVVRSGS